MAEKSVDAKSVWSRANANDTAFLSCPFNVARKAPDSLSQSLTSLLADANITPSGEKATQ